MEKTNRPEYIENQLNNTSIGASLEHLKTLSTDEFLEQFEGTVQQLFEDPNAAIHTKEFSPETIETLIKSGIISCRLPEVYGGRPHSFKEVGEVSRILAKYSLPASLFAGINGGLFLDNIAKFGSEELKNKVFEDFSTNQRLGGLALTDVTHGTDAMNMKSNAELQDNNTYKLKGEKHWQGLTNTADYWIIAARLKTLEKVSNALQFFVHKNKPENEVKMTQQYKNTGLKNIRYGVNNINVTVPEQDKLNASNRELMDMLHSSRLQFPAMAAGFLSYVTKQAVDHTLKREIKDKPIFNLEQVQTHLATIQAKSTICQDIYKHVVSTFDNLANNATNGIMANTAKALCTDYMNEAAKTLRKLYGGNGFRADNPGHRADQDSYPFTVFEGVNDYLYQQISRITKKNPFETLSNNNLTKLAMKDFLSLSTLDQPKTDTDKSLYGQIVSRLIAYGIVKESNPATEKEISKQSSALSLLNQEIQTILAKLNSDSSAIKFVPETSV